MLGRQVGTSLLRLPRCARLPVRSQPCHQQQPLDLAVRTLAPSAHRFYADVTPRRPGRPKKAVGEPSRPVKRAVKRAAKSPKEDAATKKVKANKETAQKKKKQAAKPKQKTTEQEKAKEAEKAVKRKANKAKQLQTANIAELKKIALDPPHVRKNSAWLQFLYNRQHFEDFKGGDRATIMATFKQRQVQLGEDFRNISPAEREHYNHLAHTTREKEQAAFKRYVESRTVDEIETANKARLSLRRKLKGKPAEVKKWSKITDERAVKLPIRAYPQFVVNRFASGDFKHMQVTEAARLIGQEWKALSEEERKKYNELFKQDSERFKEEYISVHGHAPAPAIPAQPAQAASAAA